MSVSVVSICNRALQKLGAQAIVSIDDNSRNARSMKRAYEPTLRALLEDHDWSFAIKQASLAAEVPAPDWGRANAFPLPDKFIRLTEDYQERVSVYTDFQIESGRIVTNASAPLEIRYVSYVTDPAAFTPLFAEALACKLAMETAAEITQSSSIQAGVTQQFNAEIAKAKKSNAIQRRPAVAADDTFITCRS